MRLISFPLIAALCMSALQGIAHSKDYGDGLNNFAESRLLENADGQYDHWRGIGRLHTDTFCTATLLDTLDPTAVGPTPAYVLTAGHCIGRTNQGNVTDTPIDGLMHFNYFVDTAQQTYGLKNLAWRSVQGTNLAIIELDVSLQALIKDGITPLKLALGYPADGTDVLTVSASLGFPKAKLRLAACTLQSVEEVILGQMVWRNNIANQCEDLAAGSAGGPILDRHTNDIIGVLVTSAWPEDRIACGSYVPCLRTANGYKSVIGNQYGTPAVSLSGCFVQGRLVKGAAPSCALYPSFTLDVEAHNPARYQRLAKKPDGTMAIPTWDYRFDISTAFYRHKTARTAKECESGDNYSDPISSVEAFINTDIGTQPGYYFLCIFGVDSATQGPTEGQLNILSLPVEILDDTPTARPNLSIFRGIGVVLEHPEGRQHTHTVNFGPLETTDCTQEEEYEPYDSTGYFFKDEVLPQRFCSIAYDKMGQASKPREDVLNPTTSWQENSPTP